VTLKPSASTTPPFGGLRSAIRGEIVEREDGSPAARENNHKRWQEGTTLMNTMYRTIAAALCALSMGLAGVAARAAPGPEYSYRLLYELSRTEFQRVNRLCSIAFNDKGHAAWIRNGITFPDGTSDLNVRQLWFHDGTQTRLLWSSTAANWVAGQDEFYPDCSGTSNVAGGSTVALNDDDLLTVLVGARSGAPSTQPGQNPPEFFWFDASQDPAPVLRTGQSASTGNFPSYGRGINLNDQGQIGFHAVTNGGTSNAGWLLTATDGLTSQSGGFPSLEGNWAAATLINDTGWIVSSFGTGGGCPANDACTVLLSVLDTTRNDALRLRSVTIGPGSAWMGGGGVQRGLGFNDRGLVSIQGVGNQTVCYPPRLSVFDVGPDPREHLIAGVGTAIQMREPGGCSNMLVTGTAMNDWNHVVFGADTEPDGVNNPHIWIADLSGNPFRRLVPRGPVSDPATELDVGGGRRIAANTNPWIGAESLNKKGQLAINTWFYDLTSPGSGTQQGILVATPCEGCSPGSPASPLEALPGGGGRFDGCRWTVAGGPLAPGQAVQCAAWQAAPPAIGHDFAVEGDGPRFATAMIPVPLPGGDDSFTIEFDGGTFPLAAGQVFRFTDHVPSGVSAFRITGIDLVPDATDPVVTRVTHVASTDVDFTVTVVPVDLNETPIASFTLRSAVIAGCKSVTGTVTLSEPAPATGATVTISDTLAEATPPASVRFPAGAVTRSFTVNSLPVAANRSGTVSVTLGPQALSRPLTLRPMGPLSVSLSPTSVTGGAGVAGVARLECRAGPAPITVNLSSTDAAVASPTIASIVIPVGAQSGEFAVATSPVLARTTSRIGATANGISKLRTLTVLPAASVSPTRLSFGSVALGSTSTLVATLSNRSDAPFTVTGISLSGTGASAFSQANDCPAALLGNSTCTISVTFAPTAAVSRSARLSIGTTATSSPLAVSLSGTGIVP